MLTIRQLLFGLFVIATVLVDASILVALGQRQISLGPWGMNVIVGTTVGQAGLLGIFLAWGPRNLVVRLAFVLSALWLCSEVAASIENNQTRVWYLLCLIHVLSVAIPLMIARRARQFNLMGLFSVMSSVCILLALFRSMGIESVEYLRLIVVAVLLASIAWISTWTIWTWKSPWLAIAVTGLCSLAVGFVLGRFVLGHLGSVQVTIATSTQAIWLTTGLLIARSTKSANKPVAEKGDSVDPIALALVATPKSDFSPRIL